MSDFIILYNCISQFITGHLWEVITMINQWRTGFRTLDLVNTHTHQALTSLSEQMCVCNCLQAGAV